MKFYILGKNAFRLKDVVSLERVEKSEGVTDKECLVVDINDPTKDIYFYGSAEEVNKEFDRLVEALNGDPCVRKRGER